MSLRFFILYKYYSELLIFCLLQKREKEPEGSHFSLYLQLLIHT
ncbi:hypothetical protein VPHD249_0163 [Vibrio phage D249]